MQHPWIVGDASELEKRDLGKNMDKLRLFNARRKFKSAISSVRTGVGVFSGGVVLWPVCFVLGCLQVDETSLQMFLFRLTALAKEHG